MRARPTATVDTLRRIHWIHYWMATHTARPEARFPTQSGTQVVTPPRAIHPLMATDSERVTGGAGASCSSFRPGSTLLSPPKGNGKPSASRFVRPGVLSQLLNNQRVNAQVRRTPHRPSTVPRGFLGQDGLSRACCLPWELHRTPFVRHSYALHVRYHRRGCLVASEWL